ncbi:MAG: precorrin-2 C(20)-methyltransferase [Bacillota bacterium]|nr:precorrin-2 C(20)-methyltransferase [Bacillota bacterium]
MKSKRGRLYGVGVGPGDPELLTLKALRVIEENQVICIPNKNIHESVAYRIVKGAYENIDSKDLLSIDMPMTKDSNLMEEYHNIAAEKIKSCLDQGQNVVFLTLGDPCIYSTYMYIHNRISQDGYETEIVNGIPSFCAASSAINIGLVEKSEALHIIPATFKVDNLEDEIELGGTKVFMKSGKSLSRVKEAIAHRHKRAYMVENCGMDDERIYEDVNNMPDEGSYYSILIVKD